MALDNAVTETFHKMDCYDVRHKDWGTLCIKKKMQCRVCGDVVMPFLDLGLQWPTDPLWETPEPPNLDRRHPLRLYFCRACGLIQIVDPIPPESIYPNASLEITSWRKIPHTDWQIELLKQYLSCEAVIVETGSNDGHFLSVLRDAGFSCLFGIEPSRMYTSIAREKGFCIREGFATPALAMDLLGGDRRQI